MRIGIYVQAARVEKLTGIGRHVVALVEALSAIDAQNEYLLYYPTSFSRAETKLPKLPSGNFRLRPVWFPRNWQFSHPRLWWDWRLPGVLRRDHIDLFHGPNHFVPKIPAIPSIVTFHDLAYFQMPVHGAEHDAALRTWSLKALERSQDVIALSNNTRADVLRLGGDPERTHVIYGGGNIAPESQIQHRRMAELRARLSLPEQYVLYVGALQPRKNVPFLVRAFATWKKKTGSSHKLVLAGPRENAAADIESTIANLGINQDVIITGYLADWELPLLYRGADVFVLPSRYEGFTLVTIEAMAYGTPVIATNSSSIQEGTGDAAILVSPDDDAALMAALDRVCSQRVERETMISRGRERAQRFTWERAAQETLALYHSVAKPPAVRVTTDQHLNGSKSTTSKTHSLVATHAALKD